MLYSSLFQCCNNISPNTEQANKFKPRYLKQRMKLNSEAIKFLYQNHNKDFYSVTEITPYL